jgi:hypothetical protein
MSTKTVIPSQLYVTVKYQADAGNAHGLIGFASPYSKDDAFQKRKITQDHWAYGKQCNVTILDDDSVTVSGHGSSDGKHWDAGCLFIANCFPRIVNNEPQEGFQLAKSVRRHGWSGAGNVMWRITDPRGFDLEISSENFANILNCCVLDQGQIQGKCVWGRMGAKNVLLPENSEPYQEALRHTRKVSKQVNLRDVRRGDIIEIISSIIPEEHQKCRYLGRVTLVGIERTPSSNRQCRDVIVLAGQQWERHIVCSLSDGSLHTLNSIKVSEVLEKVATPMSVDEAVAEINLYISRNSADDLEGAHLALAKKTARENIRYSLAAHDTVSIDSWPTHRKYCFVHFLVEKEGQFYIASLWRRLLLSLISVSWNADSGELMLETVPSHHNNPWRGINLPVYRKIEGADTEGLKFFQIQIQPPQGVLQPVKYLGYF